MNKRPSAAFRPKESEHPPGDKLSVCLLDLRLGAVSELYALPERGGDQFRTILDCGTHGSELRVLVAFAQAEVPAGVEPRVNIA